MIEQKQESVSDSLEGTLGQINDLLRKGIITSEKATELQKQVVKQFSKSGEIENVTISNQPPSQPQPSPSQLQQKVFICYSHLDKDWEKRLENHLGFLKHEHNVFFDLWDDMRIERSTDWFQDIGITINSASVGLLLISSNFINSKFISEEVPILLKKREKDLIVFLIYIKPCAWNRIKWLTRMQVRPKDGLPILRSKESQNEFQIEFQIETNLKEIAEETADTIERTSKVAGLTQKIFISYSHEDAEWLKKLQKHLKPYGLQDMIWEDTQIKPGTKWAEEINKALASAKAAILLVSPNFLASDFIANKELPLLLESAKKDGLKILWIAVSTSAYEVTEIKYYQAVNDPSKPLESFDGVELNKELVRICEKIYREISS